MAQPALASPRDRSADAYAVGLLAAFAVVWTVLAMGPFRRDVWLIENVLVVLVVPILFFTARWFRFSPLAYTAIFVFLVLHAVGAHYTYGRVPLDLSLLDGARNPYDRIVHFAFGLFIALPVLELHRRVIGVRPRWARVLAVETVLAASTLFEIMEWGVTELVRDSAGIAFIATQGDPFDSFKDVGLAALGAVVTMAASALAARARRSPAPVAQAEP